MKIIGLFFVLIGILIALGLNGQEAPEYFRNPILPGFNPDPSICRVGDDYYLVTSSFTWFPGLPIYHSKDLVNWELIGHALDRIDQVDFEGIKEKDAIYAPTLRYHDGIFYLITTCTECGGNFYLTATDPAGPWSNPIWLTDAPGIDPSLTWDDDGKCYYTGNYSLTNKSWPAQCAIWVQELDLDQQKLIGKRTTLTYGHANNAKYAEGPHIYKIGEKYLLMIAEGGTEENHSISVHHGNSLTEPFISDIINPVLTHRHLGEDYPIQAAGHGDLIQTQNGDWWAVVLAKRMIQGKSITRETFLCKVDLQNGTPIFNPGYGKILIEQPRPNLPWTPVPLTPERDDFQSDNMKLGWYCNRMPKKDFYQVKDGKLNIQLLPEVIDDLGSSAMLIKKIPDQSYTSTTKLEFESLKSNEQAGMILFRNGGSYYYLAKNQFGIELIKKFKGEKEIIATMPYNMPEVLLQIKVNGLFATFYFGESEEKMKQLGGVQSLEVITEIREFNRFNGPGIGVYVTSNGFPTVNKASYDWFEYKGEDK